MKYLKPGQRLDFTLIKNGTKYETRIRLGGHAYAVTLEARELLKLADYILREVDEPTVPPPHEAQL